MIKRVSLKITGLVQGVGYRYQSQSEARRRGFAGYVANGEHDIVQLVAEGEEEQLKDFIRWCYTGVGPAQVHTIEESWSTATGEFSDFVIQF
jgi:acylphosphatase